MTLKSTISGVDSNSYVDLTYADSYFASHFNPDKVSQWQALTSPQKITALIQATGILETITVVDKKASAAEYIPVFNRLTNSVTFFFEDVDTFVKGVFNQKLQFPRNKDIDLVTGNLFIPEEVKMAQCEQAFFLLNFDEDTLVSGLSGATSDVTTVGSISLRKEITKQGSMLAPLAIELLKPFMRTSSRLRRV